jgi:WD40 repeat protein
LPDGAVARLGTVRFRCPATSLAYSPDGKLLAAGTADNTIRLFEAATGREVRRLAGHQPRRYSPARNQRTALDVLVGSVGPGNVTAVAFSPDGKTLASGGWDEAVRLWDVATGEERRRLDGHRRGMVAAVIFSRDGRHLASRGGLDGTVLVWDAATGKELHRFDGLSQVNPWRFNRSAALAFTPDGKTLAAGDLKVIHFWDVATGKERERRAAHASCVSLAYSADGRVLASGGVDGHDKHSIRLWDTATGKELRRCRLPKDEPPISLAFAPDGRRLAAAVEEDDLRVFDVATGNAALRLKHYWPSRVAYAPNGHTLASGRGDAVRLWDPDSGAERFPKLIGHRAAVTTLAASSDGRVVASGADDVRLWRPSGEPLGSIQASGAALALSPDGHLLAAGGRDRLIHLFIDGKPAGELKGHRHPLKALAFSSDGKTLASGDAQATVRIWDVGTRREVHRIDMKSGPDELALAFSPDGRTLACAGAWNDSSFLPKGGINIQGVEMTPKDGYLVLLWDVATGKEVRRLTGLTADIGSVAFSPDGRLVAAASRDGRIARWEASTGKDVLYILAHPPRPDSGTPAAPAVAFTSDGRTLVSAGADDTVRCWDAHTARERKQFRGPGGGFRALAITQHGKRILTGGGDTTVLVWDAGATPRPPRGKDHVILIGD